METGFNNNIIVNFLNTIVSYNSIELINKSDYEIIIEGLKVYLNLPGCTSATLFSIDEETLDFYYRSSTSPQQEDNLKNIFEELVNIGAVAEALNKNDVVEFEFNKTNGAGKNALLIPLVVSSRIIGINLLILSDSLIARGEVIKVCKFYSSNFALTTSNSVLTYELNRIKRTTEQKIALRTNNIVKNTRELKKILDSIQTGIIIVNKDKGLITEANSLAVTTIGTSKDDLIGKNCNEYFIMSGDKNTDKIKQKSREGFLKTNSGVLLPIIKTVAEVSLGGTGFLIQSFLDISERKKMEDALQKAHFELEQRVEERTSQLSKTNFKLEEEIREREKAESELLKLYWAVAQSPVGILITNLYGVIEYVNNKYTDMTGLKYEEVLGSKPGLLMPDNLSQNESQDLWNTLLAEQVWTGEYKSYKKDGKLYWVSSHITPIRNKIGDITHYLFVQEDITEKKLIQDELVKAKERAEESDRLKSSLLANMSHEFRTPLIGVLGFSQLLLTELESEDHLEMVKDINDSGQRLLDTLDGVLSLSELVSIESSLSFLRINISEFLKDFVVSNSHRIRESNLELNLEIQDAELFAETDVDLLEKSIEKIFDNALKYTRKGSISIFAGISIETDKKWIFIKICDTGIGIEENYLEIIFEAFRQSSEGHNRNYEGCGLGLALAKKMIELLNGRITVTSEISKGSEFTVWLPALRNENSSGSYYIEEECHGKSVTLN